ncbi:ChaN family lipoprotein [Solidesulfovibrio sp.]|uniref:ChaN family lipoprotein n=1 Tax=Solidesulfovibrio sp. TaxID=2910990 RepID=UPI0026313E3C|nr:ChaN family lipoprotein [Solidesulfovibrio sp.]
MRGFSFLSRLGRAVLAAALLTACLCAAPWACSSGSGLRLLDVHDGTRLSLRQAAQELARCQAVVVGENHADPAHHRLQAALIRAMVAAGARTAVGLEMFPASAQPLLDGYIAGNVDEAAVEKAFSAYWGHAWELYREVFAACREAGVPLVGLNVPREIPRKVAREGFEALTPEERGTVPMTSCRVDREYEAFLRRVAGEHGGELDFRRFCEAQLVWDTAMAVAAGDYLAANPGRTLVILCGATHAWKPALPHQLRQIAPGIVQRVILPETPGRLDPATAGPGDCDYLALGL